MSDVLVGNWGSPGFFREVEAGAAELAAYTKRNAPFADGVDDTDLRLAFERGARAMAEKCAARLEEGDMDRMAERIRALPLPEYTPE